MVSGHKTFILLPFLTAPSGVYYLNVAVHLGLFPSRRRYVGARVLDQQHNVEYY